MRLRVASINDRPIKPTDDHLDEDKTDFGIVTADAAGSGLKIVMPLVGDLCPSIDDVAAETRTPRAILTSSSDEARAIFQSAGLRLASWGEDEK